MGQNKDLEKLLGVKALAESCPIQQYLSADDFVSRDSAEVKARTCCVGDFRITYIVFMHRTSLVRQISIATPLKSCNVSMLAATDVQLNAILEMFGFRHRVQRSPLQRDSECANVCGDDIQSTRPRQDRHQEAHEWMDGRHWPVLNFAELVGESDEELVRRVLGERSHLAPASIPVLLS